MKSLIRLVIAICMITVGVLSASTASASYTFVFGPDSEIDTSLTNRVLRLDVLQMADLDGLELRDMVPGESRTIPFATIGTNENWINRDDIFPGRVDATVDFTTPNVSPAVGGLSVGFSGFFKFFQGWNIFWNDPINVVADGVDFDVELKDVDYLSWFWQGPDGTADITATITLNSVNPVPVPAAVWLLGTGVMGIVAIRRRVRA